MRPKGVGSNPAGTTLQCQTCHRTFDKKFNLDRHLRKRHGSTNDEQPTKKSKPSAQWVKALKGYHSCRRISGNSKDLLLWMDEHKSEIVETLSDQAKTSIKFQLIFEIQFQKAVGDDKMKAYFASKQGILLTSTTIDVDTAFAYINRKVEEFVKLGSGWIVANINFCDIHVAKYAPIRGSTYLKLPEVIQRKKATINIQNKTDNKCFIWSILAREHPAPHNKDRLSNYRRYEDTLNTSGLEMPMSLEDIPKFEELNNLRINVYGYEQPQGLHALHISKRPNQEAINLLLYMKGDRQHYVLITDLDRLLFTQRKHKAKKYFCERCLIPFYSKEKRSEHSARCQSGHQRIQMPKEKYCEFRNIHKMLRRPYMLYADFECLTEKLPGCDPNILEAYTQKYQKHRPCSYGMLGVKNCGHREEIEDVEIYRGQDAVDHFLHSVLNQAEKYQATIDNCQPAAHSTVNLQTCNICNDSLDAAGVVEHCHICGTVRGVAHAKCNLGYRLDRDVIVGMHNLRRYDGHLIMQGIGDVCQERNVKIECVPKGMEDYLSFSLVVKRSSGTYRIRFIDTCQFLTAPLATLADNLKDLPIMERFYSGKDLELLRRKGVYCYDHTDDWSKFEETSLPAMIAFNSTLTGRGISLEDYDHASDVWNHFKIRNLGEYSDLYLKTDVILLADAFETFRKFGLETYRLDPAHYCTLPSFAWDACLLYTGAKLELLQDVDMYTFFESGIRGGVSMISGRYAKANNPYLPDTYDPGKEHKYITYLDMNNLYGKSMVDWLPVGEFEWVDEIPEEGIGYVAEVDLEYPAELHDDHNDYPLAPERLRITTDIVSPYSRQTQDPTETEKLVPNLKPKTKYIIHHRNLEYYIKKGLIVTKVHRVLKFREEQWMKPYIMFNTEMRAKATTEFEKDLYKLLNNAVFGKTMENVRKYVNIELVTDEKRFLKLVSNPRYQQARPFTENLVAVWLTRPSQQLNKPIYVGFTVLELSKLYMYKFHYDEMRSRYGDRARLLFTDTDSLAYEIRTKDWYQDMANMLPLMDTSNYPQDNQLYSDANKKVIGKMKDETAGQPIEELVGLRSKMYSIKVGNVEKKTAKGVTKDVVKHHLTHSDYLTVLNKAGVRRDQMRMIRNEEHNMYSIVVNKTSLSAYDDKRYIMDDGKRTLAHGHWRISRMVAGCEGPN